MRAYQKGMVVMALATLLMTACAHQQPKKVFIPRDLTPKLESGEMLRKAQNFIIVLDASGSMSDPYGDTRKLALAKSFIRKLVATLPDMPVQGALRSFGDTFSPFGHKSEPVFAFGDQTGKKPASDYLGALEKVRRASGKSPMGLALSGVMEDLKRTEGRTAVIIISDGKVEDMPVHQAADLKASYGQEVCIYPVIIGQDIDGKMVMDQLARVGGCGFSVYAESINDAPGMADFVEKVFLVKPSDNDGDGVINEKDACPNTPINVETDAQGCPLDSDGDGIPNYLDRCPGTPAGKTVDPRGCPLEQRIETMPRADKDGDGVKDAHDICPQTPKGVRVNETGCWILENVLFGFDDWRIQPRYHEVMDQVVRAMKANPTLKLEIQGHTDSMGKLNYNMKLSEKRAAAVKAYLLQHGISPGRLSSIGYAFTKPVAPNDTESGRAQNRRVELEPIQVRSQQ